MILNVHSLVDLIDFLLGVLGYATSQEVSKNQARVKTKESEFSTWGSRKKMTTKTEAHRCKLIAYRILCNENSECKFAAQGGEEIKNIWVRGNQDDY